MTRLNNDLARIARLPADRQVGAYRNLHTLWLKKEPGSYAAHEQILKAILQAEHAVRTVGEPLTVFAAALETQRRTMRGGLVYANMLNNCAGVLRDLRRFEEALDRHNEALAIRRAALPAGHPDIADSLNNSANVLHELRRFNEALKRHDEALAIWRAALPEGHLRIATSLKNSAAVLCDLLEFEEALARHNEALDIRRAALPAGHPDIADSLSNSANVLGNLRRFEEALAHHNEALDIRRAALPVGHPDIADTLNNSANVLHELRQYEEALCRHEEALTIQRAALPEGHPHIVTSLRNSASVLRDLRQFEEALARYNEALDLRQATLPAGDPLIADSLESSAFNLHDLRHFAEARNRLDQALAIRRATLPKGHHNITNTLNSLAVILTRLNLFDEALQYFEEALTLDRAALDDRRVNIANCLHNSAGIMANRDQLQDALDRLNEALAIRRAILPPNHHDIGASLNDSAIVLRELCRYDEALSRHNEALTLFRTHFSSQHPYIADVQYYHGVTLATLGNATVALSTVTEALTIHLHNDQFPSVSKSAWGTVFITEYSFRNTFKQTLILAADVTPLPDDTVTALLTVKGNADIEQSLTSILHVTATGLLQTRITHLQALQAEMARLQYSTDPVDLLRTQEVTRELQQTERQIHTDPEGGRLAQELHLRMITAQSVQAALQPSEALLNIFVTPDATYAQILHQDGTHHLHRYDLPTTTLEAQVEHLRSRLASPDDPGLLLHEAALLEPLQVLYVALIQPIADLLELGAGLNHLVISGDGFLYGLPWELLSAPDMSGAHPLFRMVNTRLVPTPRDLVRLHRLQTVSDTRGNPAVLMGVQFFGEKIAADTEAAPETYSETDGTRSPEIRSSSQFARRGALPSTPPTDDPPTYDPLDGTEQEIKGLQDLFISHGQPVSSYLSPDASEDTLLNVGVAPWVLHFSTHSDVWDAKRTESLYGRVQRTDPRYDPAHPFSRTVVLLDGYTGRSFKGVVRAWELGSLNLQGTALVTFSSCNSALGDMTAGRGVAGLSQAAFLAGAQRTITTLWPVLDATTPKWMVNVYRAYLEGTSWTEAVRAEKARMMDEEQPVSAWAPFVLNGLS